MEASPFSFAPERHWTEEKERVLISYFAKHSCLWNHKSESYKNRQLRWKTLEQLRMLLSNLPPPAPFTVEDIKNKFKNLRTTFQRQYKLVRASKVCGSDDVFVPQWKHYQQLMFLQGCRDLDDDADAPPLSPPPPPQQEESRAALAPPGLVISFLPAAANNAASSCLPLNMPAKCFWTEEKERALIDFYCEHSCLWNKKSENHNNRQLRLRLLETLRSQLSDQAAAFSVDDIKCKFKNLRTVFNREYKAVQASRASDKVYQSKWKHYQKLLFLCEFCGDDDDPPDDLYALLPQEERDPEHGDRTPSSTLSSLSSSSVQTGAFPSVSSPSGCAQTDVKPAAAGSYQIFLPASPDNVKAEGQKGAGSASPSPSPLDAKPSANPSLLSFAASVTVHSDSRPVVDTRCHWTDAKVQQLISFYSNHSCLWNHRSESYRNRLLRHSLLESLSRLLSDKEPLLFTVEDIKTKFRNLRTFFQREHKAVSSNKTCGSEDFYLPKWKHYRELMFLCDSCDEDEQPGEPRFRPPPREPGLLRLEGHAPPPPHPHPPPPPLHYQASLAAPYQPADGPKSAAPPAPDAPPSPTPPDSQRSSPLSSTSTASSSRDHSRVSGRKRASRRSAAAANASGAASGQVLDLMRTLCQSQAASPHAGFLKYVEECLNETPPDKVKRLKKMIIDTIHSASEDA